MIYVDMDGVLVDFNGRIRELFEKDFVELNNDWVWEQLMKIDNLYLDLKPLEDYIVLWQAIEHLNPLILTAIPSKVNMSNVREDKLKWVKNYLGNNIEVKYGPYSINKQEWCKFGDILIDDSPLNITQWESRGGHGILHTSAENTIIRLKKLNII